MEKFSEEHLEKIKKTLESCIGEIILVQSTVAQYTSESYPMVRIGRLRELSKDFYPELHVHLEGCDYFGGIKFGGETREEEVARVVNCKGEKIYEDEEVIKTWERSFLREELIENRRGALEGWKSIDRYNILRTFGVELPEPLKDYP